MGTRMHVRTGGRVDDGYDDGDDDGWPVMNADHNMLNDPPLSTMFFTGRFAAKPALPAPTAAPSATEMKVT